MKAFIISDNTDSLLGMKMAGIKGLLAHTKDEVIKALEDIKNNEEVGIIIITEKAANLIPEELNQMKLSKSGPLIIEIQDRHGSIRGDDYIAKYMKESIGLKI